MGPSCSLPFHTCPSLSLDTPSVHSFLTLLLRREHSCQVEFLQIDALHLYPPGPLTVLAKAGFLGGVSTCSLQTRRAGRGSKAADLQTQPRTSAVCLWSLSGATTCGHRLWLPFLTLLWEALDRVLPDCSLHRHRAKTQGQAACRL